jgi:Leucine-rich repeat (LRR) protein
MSHRTLTDPPATLAPFADPTALRSLILRRGFVDIGAVRALTRLETLQLQHCRNTAVSFTDLGPVATLPQLQRLDLVDLTGVTDFSALRALRRLEQLFIVGCPGFHDAGLLRACRRTLRVLHLEQTYDDKGGSDDGTKATPALDVRRLPYFPRLTRFVCRLPAHVTGLAWVPAVLNVTATAPDVELEVCGSRGLTDLRALRRCPAVHVLSLFRCPRVTTLADVAHLPRLRELDLDSCTGVTNLTPLARCVHLRTLKMDSVTLTQPLPVLPALQRLSVRYTCTQALIDRLPQATPALAALDIGGDVYPRATKGITSLLPLLACPHLRTVAVRFVDGLTEDVWTAFFADARALTRFTLAVGGRPDGKYAAKAVAVDPWLVTDSFVAHYLRARRTTLTRLDLTAVFECTHLPSGAWMAGCTALREVYLGGTNVRDLTPLAALPHLERLDCCDAKGNAAPILSVAPLAGCGALRRLSLRRCDALQSLAALDQCPQLASLDVRGCDRVPAATIQALARRPKLSVTHDLVRRDQAQRYRTHDNGGRPFEVHVAPDRTVTVYKQRPPAETASLRRLHAVYDRTAPVFHGKVAEVFVGRSPLNAWTAESDGYGEHGPACDGNTMLFRTRPDRFEYLFVGRETLKTFRTRHAITRFVSYVGSNDVPYPYAVDDVHNVFYDLTGEVVCTKLSSTTASVFNAYCKLPSFEADCHRVERWSVAGTRVDVGKGDTPTSQYTRYVQKGQATRKRDGLPTTHVTLVAHRAHTRRSARQSRGRRWYTLPYTVVADYARQLLHSTNDCFEWAAFRGDTTHRCRWHHPQKGTVRCLLQRERAPADHYRDHPDVRSLAAHGIHVVQREKAVDVEFDDDHHLFASSAEARAYAKDVEAVILPHPIDKAKQSVFLTQHPHAYRLLRLPHPLRIRPHPSWPGHVVLCEQRTEPPRSRVVTRKQYVALHKAYTKRVGVEGMRMRSVH